MKLKLLSIFPTLLFFASAFADEAAIRQGMEIKFPYTKIISISKTSYFGLYEVAFDDQLVYTDENMTYLFSGNIIDLQTMQNLTKAREKHFYAISFGTLPFDLAIKNVKGKGERKLAVFSDPNCQYCKKLEKEMVGLNNVTIYIFLLPILPGSEAKSRAIWCSPDRLNAWEDHMLKGIEPQLENTCDAMALPNIAQHAEKLRVNVTPTLIFEDGVIKPGTLTLELLEAQLAEASGKK